MKKLVIEMAHTYETKGTHRYDAVADGEPIPSMYIKKQGSVFEGGYPIKITVTVEAAG